MDVIALTETGARDPGWPGGGEQLLGPVPSSFGYGVTMRQGGGAYIVGDGNFPGQNDNFVVGRLTSTGTLDTTFGGDGYVDYNIDPTTGGDTAWAAALVGDTLYVCGIADYDGDTRFALIALRPDGSLAPSFATSGVTAPNFTSGRDECKDIAYDGTNLAVTGTINGEIAFGYFILAGTGSLRRTMLQGTGNSIALGGDGTQIVVAEAGASGYLMRFIGDTLDPMFGTAGVVSTQRDALNDVALDAEGRIVVVGRRDDTNPVVFRFLPDGTLDPSFADAGVFAMPIPGQFFAVAIDGRGRIVAVGYDDSGAREQPLVVRLQ